MAKGQPALEEVLSGSADLATEISLVGRERARRDRAVRHGEEAAERLAAADDRAGAVS